MRDIKEVVGLLMRALANGEITQQEVLDLEFKADGELLIALNEAYIQLLEFTHDHDLRRADREADEKQRAALQASLNRIVRLCDTLP
jgi:hypothetical protein